MRSLATRIGTFALLAASFAGAALVAPACGGDKPVNYPSKDGGGGIVTDNQGGQVGVVEGAGTSGLEGSAKSAYDTGWQAWLRGDLQTAKKQFQEAASLAPKSPSPPYSLGVVLEHLGDVSGAQQSYRTAFSNDPEHELSMCAYALSLANGKSPGEADTFLTDKRAKKKESPRLTTCSAEVKSIQKDHASAQQLGQDALRMDPNYKDAMVTLARDHYRARKMDLAKYALQAVLEGFGDATPARDKDNAEAHLLRGLIMREEGKRIVALKDFEEASKRRPDLVEALVNLGSMRLEAGNANEAVGPLEQSTKFAPNNALAHLNLGDCYRLLQRYPDAKNEFDKALSLDSSLAAAHYDLGLMYLTAQNIPGTSADQQVSTAIKELETYKTMRGPKPPLGVNDEIDDLLNRAKAKQAELKNTVATPPAAAGAAPAGAAPAGAAPAGAAPAAKPDGGGIARDMP
jgi:tetratricopeptide (TPR) repeat protein